MKKSASYELKLSTLKNAVDFLKFLEFAFDNCKDRLMVEVSEQSADMENLQFTAKVVHNWFEISVSDNKEIK